MTLYSSPTTVSLTWTGRSKQKRGPQKCPPASVAADQSPPVMREPQTGGRRLSPLPEKHRRTNKVKLV